MNPAAVVVVLLIPLVLWSVETEAAQARIEGFQFSCTPADGRSLKPANGDIEGSVYTDLPVQRVQCRQAIKFKIGLCLDNTEFASSEQGREFPDCQPVFEAQSQDCVRHFLRERAKCDAGSDGMAEAADDLPTASEDGPAAAADEARYAVDPLDELMIATRRAHVRAGPGPEHLVLYTLEVGAGVRVTGQIRNREWFRVDRRKGDKAAFVGAALLEEFVASAPGEAGAEVKSPAILKPFGPNWIVVENQPCQIWNPHPVAGETVTWTGDCVDGKGSGKGRTVWKDSNGTSTHEGERWQGKRYGWGVVIEAEGDRFEGEFRNNRAHGQGILTWTDGRRYEGEWRSGKPHGHGTFTEPAGDRFEGNCIRGCFGNREGRWARAFASAEACGFE